MGERKETEPRFGRLDDLEETHDPSQGLRSDESSSRTWDTDPGVSSASGLTTRDQPVQTMHAQVPGSPGEQLRGALERMGLDRDELAQRTRLSRRTIEDLEANRFNQIPPTYVRGYLRVLARELNADGEAWVRSYEEFGFAEPPVRPTMQAPAQAKPSRSRRWYVMILVLIIVVLGLGIYAWKWKESESILGRLGDFSWFSAQTLPEPATGAGDEAQAVAPVPDANEALLEGALAAMRQSPRGAEAVLDPVPVPPRVGGDLVIAIEEGVAPAPPTLAQASEPTEAASAPSLPDAAALTPGSARVSPEPVASAGGAAPGQSALEVSFREASWVEIRSASDRVALRGVFDRGDTHNLTVDLPARIVLGNAPGVTMMRDGAEVDLAAHTRDDRTARFDLGAD